MATIVNNPGPGPDSSGSAAVWVVGLIVLVLIVLGALFVWPKFATMQPTNETQPTTTTGDNSAIPPVVNNYTTINASTTVNSASSTNP